MMFLRNYAGGDATMRVLFVSGDERRVVLDGWRADDTGSAKARMQRAEAVLRVAAPGAAADRVASAARVFAYEVLLPLERECEVWELPLHRVLEWAMVVRDGDGKRVLPEAVLLGEVLAERRQRGLTGLEG